jgi:hypothetical protein
LLNLQGLNHTGLVGNAKVGAHHLVGVAELAPTPSSATGLLANFFDFLA